MFALRGPEFLALFAGLAVVVYFAVDALIAAREARIPSQMRIRDPYAIAYLRGDSRELVRVVALSLGLRGLLQVGKATFKTVDAAEIDRVQIPVEKEILRLCQTFCAPPALVKSPQFQAAVDEYRRDLVALGLLADDDVRNARWLPIFGGIAVLGAIALIKIWVALSTGHSNIVLLVMLAGVAGIVLILRALGRRTLAGNTALSNLKTLFASLRSRAYKLKGDAVAEATLLAAVFGIYTLRGLDAVSWKAMFPNPSTSNSSGGCGSGGSSCGGGGSGCGGGGGCGGCGS